MNEQMKESMAETVDMSMDDFKSFCAEKDRGYLMGLENIFTVVYNSTNGIKHRLIEKLENEKSVCPNTRVQYENLFENVELKIISLVGKIYALREMQKERDDRIADTPKKTNQDI